MSLYVAHEVLVIDDEPAIGEEICDALSLRNIRARYAENLAQARTLLKANDRIAIISVDYNMPGMNGGEVIEMLKREFRRPMAFIMITGDGRQEIAIEAMRAHVQDFVTKPIDGRALVAAIRRAEEQLARLAETDVLQAKLDTQSRVLSERIDAISGKLQQREALLRQLMLSERGAIDTLTDEIRAPLAPLLDHIKQLKSQLLDTGNAKDAALAQSVMQSGLKLAHAVEAIFGTGTDPNSDPLKCLPVDVADMIKRIAPALRRLAAENQVQLKTRIPTHLPFLYADESRLARALSDIAIGLMSELSAGDHLAMMAMIENQSLITSFRISAQKFDERILSTLTGELAQSLEGLDSIKPSIPKFVSARIIVNLHGGRIDVDDRHSPLRLIKLHFPLPEADQAAVRSPQAMAG